MRPGPGRPPCATHLYLAGGTDLTQIDIPSFLRQAKEYEEVDDIRDSILKAAERRGS